MGLLRRLRAILNERSSAPELGWAVALGVVVGTSPFFGLHSLLGIALATLCRLNRPVVLIGAQVSIPPLIPFLLFAQLQVGTRVLHHAWIPLTLQGFRSTFVLHSLTDLSSQLLPNLLVGWAVTGVGLSVIFGGLTRGLVAWRRNANAAAASSAASR